MDTLERDLAERYRRGEVSLRKMAEVLGCPPREVPSLANRSLEDAQLVIDRVSIL